MPILQINFKLNVSPTLNVQEDVLNLALPRRSPGCSWPPNLEGLGC